MQQRVLCTRYPASCACSALPALRPVPRSHLLDTALTVPLSSTSRMRWPSISTTCSNKSNNTCGRLRGGDDTGGWQGPSCVSLPRRLPLDSVHSPSCRRSPPARQASRRWRSSQPAGRGKVGWWRRSVRVAAVAGVSGGDIQERLRAAERSGTSGRVYHAWRWRIAGLQGPAASHPPTPLLLALAAWASAATNTSSCSAHLNTDGAARGAGHRRGAGGSEGDGGLHGA